MDKIKEAVDGSGFHPDLSPEQLRAVKHIRARQMMRTEDTMNMNSFGTDAIGGLVPNLARGNLGLHVQEPFSAASLVESVKKEAETEEAKDQINGLGNGTDGVEVVA